MSADLEALSNYYDILCQQNHSDEYNRLVRYVQNLIIQKSMAPYNLKQNGSTTGSSRVSLHHTRPYYMHDSCDSVTQRATSI